jgi:hypothetical protein
MEMDPVLTWRQVTQVELDMNKVRRILPQYNFAARLSRGSLQS